MVARTPVPVSTKYLSLRLFYPKICSSVSVDTTLGYNPAGNCFKNWRKPLNYSILDLLRRG